MRIFVVGGTGAIGRLLVPLLVERGHEVAGARQVLTQGAAFSYGPGEGLADEGEPPRDDEAAGVAFATDDAALASELEVVVARYGYFYGPGTWWPPSEAEPFEPPRRGASNARIKAELGWAPTYPTWPDGFREGL